MTMRYRILLATLATTTLFAADPDGAALFKMRCAACHEGPPQERMPTRKELASRTPEAVMNAMFAGTMMVQAAGLTNEEGRAIARFVAGKEFAAAGGGKKKGQCNGAAPPPAVRPRGRD